MGRALNKQILLGILTAKFKKLLSKSRGYWFESNPPGCGTHTAIPANGTMTFNHAFFRVLFSIVGVTRQKRTVSWLGSSGGLKIRRSSFNSNTVHLCAQDLVVRVVCKTIQDGSNPSVHLRLGVMVSTQDFGSWNIGSSPMAAASHSFNGKDRGLLIPRYRFESCMRHLGM